MTAIINHALGVYNRRVDALSADDSGTPCADESYDNIHEIMDLSRRIEMLDSIKRRIKNHARYQIMFSTK